MEYVKKEVNCVPELYDVFKLLANGIKAVRIANKDGFQSTDLIGVITAIAPDLAKAIAGMEQVPTEMKEDLAAFSATALVGASEIVAAFKQPV